MVDYFTSQILAKCGYRNYDELPDEWRQIGDTVYNSTNGFTGKVFMSDTGEIVISYSGTDILEPWGNDVRNDLNMVFGNEPPQVQDAKVLYERIKKQYPNAKITLTGESLGGSVAAIIAAKTGAKAITYSAFGVGGCGEYDKEYNNITNIGDTRDYIFMCNINQHLGKVYIIPDNSGKIYMPEIGISYHGIDNMGFLIDMQKYERGSIQSFMDTMEFGEDYKALNITKNVTAELFKKYDNIRPVLNHRIQNKNIVESIIRNFPAMMMMSVKNNLKKIKTYRLCSK